MIGVRNMKGIFWLDRKYLMTMNTYNIIIFETCLRCASVTFQITGLILILIQENE